MSNTKTVMGQAANTQGIPLDITDVFSTYLYTGTGANQTITNGLDLAGDGGLTWIKRRNAADSHVLTDSERGYGQVLNSDTTGANQNLASLFNLSTTSSGFTVGSNNTQINNNAQTYVSWSFKKQTKFFDVVTWTGDGSTDAGGSRLISHALGSAPGFIIVKKTSSAASWYCYHRELGATKAVSLNSTGVPITSANWWYNVEPTSTNFSVNFNFNENNETYVAYVFAHNNGDGEFGPDADQDIIKCGSFTGPSATVNLGFEPAWILTKDTAGSGNWIIYDAMRGMYVGSTPKELYPNTSGAESNGGNFGHVSPSPTGFSVGSGYSATYIYMAIRRGPLAQPESGTEVFAISDRKNQIPSFPSGFPVDFLIGARTINGLDNNEVKTRLISGGYLRTSTSGAEVSSSQTANFAHNDGFFNSSGANANQYCWMWKRAPGYFDVVAYTGTGATPTVINHNLNVAPEMMLIKSRTSNENWMVYHSALGNTKAMVLTASTSFTANTWNNTTPSATTFTLGGGGNNGSQSGQNYIAYLFATLAGISKVGSYTGNGTSQIIDCGFTSGARFIIIKRTDSTGDWYVWDTERGIVADNDPHLSLNSTAVQVTSDDSIDPDNSGFIVNQVGATNINVSSATYIFYAIA